MEILLKGFVVVTIPVGNIPFQDVPGYIRTLSNNMLGDDLWERTKKAGYEFFFMPSRDNLLGPRMELLRLDNDEDAAVDVVELLSSLPDDLKAKIGV